VSRPLVRPFRVTTVMQAHRHRAARRCVMVPWFGPAAKPLLRDVPAGLARLRAAWVARLLALRDAGWKALKARGAVGYMANCPPTGVRTDTTARRCGRASVCPFCFARRRVLHPFRLLETVLYGASGPYLAGQRLWEAARGLPVTAGGTLLPLKRPDLQIVWFRSRSVRPPRGTDPYGLATAGDYLRKIRAGLTHRRRTVEVAWFKAEYAEVQFDLFPNRRAGGTTVVRSGVLLVPGPVAPDALAAYGAMEAGAAKCGVLPPSKENLAAAFYRAVRYPRQLLRADPAWAVAALHALDRFRSRGFTAPPGVKAELYKSAFVPKPRQEG